MSTYYATYNVTIPMRIDLEILFKFVERLANEDDVKFLSGEESQWVKAYHELQQHADYQDVLNEQFAPFCFHQLLYPKISEILKDTNLTLKIENVAYTDYKLIAESNVDNATFLVLASQAFGDFFTQDIAAHARYVDGLRYAIGRGLGRYILENHYEDLVAMFKPLLENHRSDELVDCARIQRVPKEIVAKVLKDIQKPVKALAKKGIRFVREDGSVVPLQEKDVLWCVLSSLNIVYKDKEGGVVSAFNSGTPPTRFVRSFFNDCETYLADGALFPSSALDNYIRVCHAQKRSAFIECFESNLFEFAFYKDATKGGMTYDVEGALDPVDTTVCFSLAVLETERTCL